MCIYNYNFSFGSKKFKVCIEAANKAEANFKFKDVIIDSIQENLNVESEKNLTSAVNYIVEADRATHEF